MSDMEDWTEDDEYAEAYESEVQYRDNPANWWDVAWVLVGGISGFFKVIAVTIDRFNSLINTRSIAHDRKVTFRREALEDIEKITGGQDG